ncbi:PaaX family transcriptional regulator C-terminal domain-containing protein [Celeribacter persicus]|uniref:PaaX family transcriptional regulator n=1 Tax=Celeribacter persicus TaxID=1651082 RepID=A0A2T5HGJ0_9RHOB|nr:PaaX family transcriptional regulator C-terminal domain-containing protein [Celeribacter persicus]PTQ70687.1 PaaX family transcriptional regulator [Celeribacter persicus]
MSTLLHFPTPPRATGFIVTIYGDAVEPRGGVLWMGTLVEACAEQGISESLVRTAVSRLVTAGKLVGERIGRKSYYRLTEAARSEFQEAARVLYLPPVEPTGWRVCLKAPAHLPAGWVAFGEGVAVAPDRQDVAPVSGPVLSGFVLSGAEELAGVMAQHWDFAPIMARYDIFLEMFSGLSDKLAQKAPLSGAAALALRLRLVHHYRLAALADPRLPKSAWPANWPAPEARRIFVESYLALAEAADRHIGRSFHDSEGTLPDETPATRQRLSSLTAEAGR